MMLIVTSGSGVVWLAPVPNRVEGLAPAEGTGPLMNTGTSKSSESDYNIFLYVYPFFSSILTLSYFTECIALYKVLALDTVANS
ncbi:hypothetical protein DENSPDRAFT_692246 [Dentipellis sp. KUC8613]|nr:hypothetical protein DENSPDRAFT_692246 [Dentipellis sp. KUC8613]